MEKDKMSRKELMDAYKNIKFRAGVFQIRNLTNDKIFVEGSVNLDKIWNRHLTQLNFGGHESAELQKDWKALGEQNFAFEIISELDQSEDGHQDLAREVKRLETMFLEELQPYEERGYNRRPRNK